MIIGFANDHAGFELKQQLLKHLEKHTIVDFGTYSTESCDYPDFAHKLGQAVSNNKFDLSIAICGSGNGIAITLNKHANVRAALCWDIELAAFARAHNNANICVLPARFISVEKAIEIVDTFLISKFEGGKHQCRIDKINL